MGFVDLITLLLTVGSPVNFSVQQHVPWRPSEENLEESLDMSKERKQSTEAAVREIRRRTRVVGAFPDGESAVMLVGARLRHIASTSWGTRKYMSMDWLKQQDMEAQRTA